MKKIKLYLSVFLIGSLVIGCNSETDDLGVQLFNKDAVSGEVNSYDLVVYNVNNGDEVRADSYALSMATLGAFTESQFGMQKASYVTQVRLSSYSPNLGSNPVVDSVVVELKPEYYTSADSIVTSRGNLNYNGVSVMQTMTTYKAVKYGKAKSLLTIKVSEVTEDLGVVGTELKSNKKVSEGVVLGTKVFDGNVRAINIVNSLNNNSLLNREAGIRINLDKAFFQQKIANKNGGAELASESAFVNYFKGLRFYVEENDGYLLTFTPNEVKMTMYYYNDSSKGNTLSLNLGASNVHLSQIAYNRSSNFNAVMNNVNTTDGDALLYVQGMGGSGVGVKLSGETIESLKKQYKNNNSAILSAKIRLYTASIWNNTYTKPSSYLVKELGSDNFLTDLITMQTNANYSLVTAYALNTNSAYYDIDITKTIKDIVEKGGTSKDLVINVGSYLRGVNGSLVSENYNSNVYSPNRVILVGTDATNKNRVRLIVTNVVK